MPIPLSQGNNKAEYDNYLSLKSIINTISNIEKASRNY